MSHQGRLPRGRSDPERALCAAILLSAVEDADDRFLRSEVAEQMATYLSLPIDRLRQAATNPK